MTLSTNYPQGSIHYVFSTWDGKVSPAQVVGYEHQGYVQVRFTVGGGIVSFHPSRLFPTREAAAEAASF